MNTVILLIDSLWIWQMFVVILSAVSKYLKVLNGIKGPANKIIHTFPGFG